MGVIIIKCIAFAETQSSGDYRFMSARTEGIKRKIKGKKMMHGAVLSFFFGLRSPRCLSDCEAAQADRLQLICSMLM